MLSPTRRTFLFLGALTGVQLLCGCTDEHESDSPGAEHRPDQDLPLRTRAVAATDALLAGYDSVLAGPGAAQGDLLRKQREEVAQHRSALAQGLPTTPATPSGASGSAPASAPTSAPGAAPGAAIGTVAALAAAERQTATDRLADLEAASPALARLLASVSAAGALHATRLGDTGPVGAAAASPAPSAPPSGSASAAPSSGTPAPLPSAAATGAQSALAAEHAAVYGYGVACAYLPVGRQREDGRADYLAHQARRDAWQRLLRAGGAGPTAAAAGYRLPFAVKDQATAGQLAAHIETQLTTVYADVVGAGTGPVRLQAAGALRESVLRAAHWGAAPSALPGLPAPADAPASPPPSPSPSR